MASKAPRTWSAGADGLKRPLGPPRPAPAAVPVHQIGGARRPPAPDLVRLESAGIIEQRLHDPPGLEHAVLPREPRLGPREGVGEQPLVRSGLVAELLLEKQVEVDPVEFLLTRLLRLEEDTGPRVGIDAEDDLVGRRDRAAADAHGGRALQDDPHLGDLFGELLPGPDEDRDAGP